MLAFLSIDFILTCESVGKPGKLVQIPEGQVKSLCTAARAPKVLLSRAPCQTWIIQGFLRSEVSWAQPVLKHVLCISRLTCNPSFLQATMNWAKRKLDEPPCYRDKASLMRRFFAMTAVFQPYFGKKTDNLIYCRYIAITLRVYASIVYFFLRNSTVR